MAYFKFDGFNLYYNVFPKTGKKSSVDIKSNPEYLFLLHGNSVSSKMFKSEVTLFQKYYNVVVFDYLGLGKSDRIPYFRDDYWAYNALSLQELVSHLGITGQVDMIGTSGGALTGLNYLVTNSMSVRKMIADSFMGFGISKEDSDSIVRRRTKAKSQLLNSAFWKDMNGEDWERVVDQDIDLMGRCGDKQLLTIKGDLSNITCEVLCIAAITDELIPHTDQKVKEVADKISNSRLQIYDYGKHPFMITQKKEFKRLALDFLELGLE